MSFRVVPLTRAELPGVAAYLAAQNGIADPAGLEQRLAGRLFENPAGRDEVERGHLLMTDTGGVAGASLAIPHRFVAGSRELFGLCSSAMYVDTQARLQGFLMFRRFLTQPGVDFWFATTCNDVSARLWERSEGVPVESSRRELILPLRPAAVARAFAPGAAQPLAVAAAAMAAPVLRLVRANISRSVTLQPAGDWQQLAALAERHRDMSTVTTARTAPYLRWRYGSGPEAPARRVWLATDGTGREGWISAATFARSTAPGLRSWMVLDYAWPPGADLAPLLLSATAALEADADLVALRGDAADAVRSSLPIGLRRTFPVAPTWVSPATNGLALVPADGDTAP
jgi:hypothetical protein